MSESKSNYQYTRRIAAYSVVLPILILFFWVGRIYLQSFAPSRNVRLPIVGVDPRDLIAGHYFSYRIEFGAPIDCSTSSGTTCVCLEPATQVGSPSVLWKVRDQVSCENADVHCNSPFVRGECEDGKFVTGLDRYFFDEKDKSRLAVVPEGASISLALDENGTPTLIDVFVGELTLKEWLKTEIKEGK